MPTNKYFNNFTYSREQDVLEDLIIESIKQYGHEVKYLPRTLVEQDHLFGEAKLSKFDDSVPVEMYIKSVEGFEGEGEFLSKFGVEIRDQVTFTIARKRFDQVRGGESIQDEVGYQLQTEEYDANNPSRQFLTDTANTFGFMIESGTAGANNYTITANRPNEGDLIYFPLTDKLFEIKFVEHEQVFYQMGRLQTYDLKCELFTYSSERIDTGDSDVDSIEDALSNDILFNQLTLEEALDRAVGSIVLSTPHGSISSVTITNGGVYGATPPTITLSDPESRSNTAATLFQASPYPQGTGYSNGIATTSYTSVSGPGSGLTVQIVTNVNGAIQSLPTIVDPGENYRNSDVLKVDGGDNATFLITSTSDVTAQVADLEVVMSGNTVSSVTVNDGGSGYFTGTTITFSQDTISGVMQSEDGDSIIQEFTIETTDNQANNQYFTQQADSIIDFTEFNPFSEVDRY